MNPDPNGEPWIAGGLGSMTEEERAAFENLPTFTLPAHLKGRQLPPTCDNSTRPEFRPIFSQIGGSCGQASGTGYHFTYERNLTLGTTAVETKNRCAYGFTWNFVNGGSQTAWMDGYQAYHNGNDCHVTEIVKFQVSDIEGMKNWFYDKGMGTGKNGGCVTFCSNCDYPTTTIASGPYKGEKLCTSLTDGNAHAMTFAGYSDEISSDVNGDGKITNDIDITRDGVVDYRDYETGAIQLVNSWGSSWINKGKVWVRYSGIKCNTIVGIKVAKHVPKLECKVKISHSSRSNIRITTGVSNDINASSPTDTMMYAKAFNYAGGSYPMEGSGGSNEIEIGLDATKLYNKLTGSQAKIFLVIDSKGGTGQVASFSVLDYSHGEPPVEFTCTQQNVAINTGKTTLFVVISGTPIVKTVSFSIKGFAEESCGTFTVKPALPPMSINGPVWPENRKIVDGKDIGVYAQNAMHPLNHIQVSSNGRMYCYKVVEVQVNLARHNPFTGELRMMKGGELAVAWEKEAKYDRSRTRLVTVPVSVKKRVKSLVVNYSEFASAYEADFSFTRASKMVIITTAAIKSGSKKLTDFVASKALRGVEATIVTDWGTTAANLRTWLQNNYQTMGIEYVLLIGHYTSDVPMMDFTSYSGSDNCPSDWPFAQLDGSDYKSDKTCELHVGRIPIYNNNLNTLDSILTKTIAYESSASADIAWRKNAFFAGPGYNSGSNMACVPLNAVYADFVQKLPPWQAYRIYGTTYGQPTNPQPDEIGTESAVVAKWKSSSFGIVDWATHGSPTSASYVLSSSNTANIGNKYPAYVFCGSCSNASPSSATNLSYSILKNCGIGAIGGTDLTYYGGDYKTTGSDNAWAYYFGKFMIGDSMDIGGALTALREMAPSSFQWLNRAPYVLYGDPSLGILTCQTSSAVTDGPVKKELTYDLKFCHSSIWFSVPENGKKECMVSIKLYSSLGKIVKTLWRGNVGAGHHFISINDRVNEHERIAAGLYVCTMEATGIRKAVQVLIQER